MASWLCMLCILAAPHLVWFHIIFDLWGESAFEASNSSKFVIHFQCCFYTCYSARLCAWTCNSLFCQSLCLYLKQHSYFLSSFLLVCGLSLPLLFGLDLSCFVCMLICLHLYWSCIIWQFMIRKAIQSLASPVMLAHFLALQRNCINIQCLY